MAVRTSSRESEGATEASESPVETPAEGTRMPMPPLRGLHVELPPADELLYFAGVGALAALEVIEWPVALVAAAGLALARRRPRPRPGPDPAQHDGSPET